MADDFKGLLIISEEVKIWVICGKDFYEIWEIFTDKDWEELLNLIEAAAEENKTHTTEVHSFSLGPNFDDYEVWAFNGIKSNVSQQT